MTLAYTNGDGVSIALSQSPPFFLTRLDGTGNLSNQVNTFKAPSQDGAFFVGSALDVRHITIEGTIAARDTNEAYTLRQRLLRIFTPKSQGVLQYRDRRVTCVVEDIKLAVSTKERVPNFFISLLCPSPFFEALDSIREELALWRPLFQFPLWITPPGIELGARQPSQIITVINVGDVPCGIEIVFSALGTVTNPELLNVNTGEYVRVFTNMQAGEEIHVYTHFAGKRVETIINNTTENAFSLLDVHSTFLQLAVGTNTLRYNAADGLELLSVSLYYSPQYLGV
jgi:hypothetical protein